MTALQQNIDISPEQQSEYYQTHRDRFIEARALMIHISPGANARESAQVAAKKARSGESFAELQKQFTHAKDLELTLTRASTTPAPVRAALASGHEGSIIGPVETETGFYIFKLISRKVKSLEEVQSVVYTEIQQNRLQELIREIRNSVEVTIN